MLCAWCGAEVEAEAESVDGGLCETCEDHVAQGRQSYTGCDQQSTSEVEQ